MNANVNLTIQTASRFGTAALLLAAAGPGHQSLSESLLLKPANVFASVAKQPASAPMLAAAMKPRGSAHMLATATKHTGSHAIAAVTKHPASRHVVATTAKPRPSVATPKSPLVAEAKQPEIPHTLAALEAPAPATLEPSAAAASFNMTGTGDGEHALHLTVGHLMFLNTKERVRRIYIANPAVLDSYTVTPNQIVLTAKTPGLSSVVVWDQNDQSQVYMVSSDIDVGELRASMKQAIPNDNVQVEGRETKVILSGTVGTDALSETAAKLAGLYSKDVANSLIVNSGKVRQVRLKVRIVEVDRSKLNQFGINIFNPGGSTTIAGGTTSQFPVTTTLSSGGSSSGTGGTVGGSTLTVSDPLNFLFYTSKINLGVTIKDLENKQILQILAEPNITTISGQKASFLAGGEFPFPVVQGGTGGLASVSVQFRPYGVKLDFTPQVNVDGSIALKVSPEVSALDFTNAVTISGYTIPALSTKRAETQVVLRSGQSFAISGLLDRRTTDAFSKTPGISSVPILGQLFKSKGITLSTSELIVIVTPTIVDPLSESLEAEEPTPVVPFMKPEAFDKSLPASAKKN